MQDAMREEKPAPVEQATDEELFEVLIAISGGQAAGKTGNDEGRQP